MGRGRTAATRLLVALVVLVGGAAVGAVATPGRVSAAPVSYTATFRVFATDEGLVGGTTANGHVIQPNDHFVALPCSCALSSDGGNQFQVKINYNGKSTIAPVWDTGPWNTNDDYWDPPAMRTWSGIPQGVPEAAAAYYNHYNNGEDGSGRKVQIPAGIDLADGTFNDLGLTQSDWVTVTFLWVTPPPAALPPLPAGYQNVQTIYFGQRPPLDPVPKSSDPSYTYFPETGHNVPQPIMDYYNANGGWRNIGLPLTELFREVQPDGTVRLVQYFERQILQLNPPPSKLPLVESDLIGYSAPAPPSSRAPIAPFPNDAQHVYFPQTQHSLSYGFLSEWEKYGGLQAFGYPITEEFSATTPDGRRYVAQIFERARFEWWPDRVGKPDEITHGLLVTDLLRQAGWIN